MYEIENEAKQQAAQHGYGALGRSIASNIAIAPDSLAQVAPRLITAALEVGKIADHIECSFGISVPTKDGASVTSQQQPTLMSQLKMVESVLQRAALALENINRHVNG